MIALLRQLRQRENVSVLRYRLCTLHVLLIQSASGKKEDKEVSPYYVTVTITEKLGT